MHNAIKVLLTIMICILMWPVHAELKSKPKNTKQAVPTTGTRPGNTHTLAKKPSHPVSVSAKLDLAKLNHRLYASILLQQAVRTPGRIFVEWTPPVNSSCQKSRYALSYRGKQYHTQSYRTVIHSTHRKMTVCSGNWIVKVKEGDGRLLATASLNITPPIPHHDKIG